MINTQNDEVTFEHPSYEAHKKQLEIVNAVYHGIDTARPYIYKTPNENNTDYTNRTKVTPLDNFVERIVTTMSGQIFRKPLSYDDIPDSIVNNVFPTIAGSKNLNQFSKDLSELAIRDGKAFILVDIAIEGGDPFFSAVERSQLINWEKNDEGQFTFAVIEEAYLENTGTFAKEYKKQYRVLLADGNVNIYRENDGGWDIEEITTSYDFVPLYELSTGEVPPLYDIAVLNLNYLNRYSKKDQYLDTAGSPIPFGKGLGINGENDVLGEDTDVTQPALVLGVNSVVLTDNTEASFEWVEMTGQAIDALQNDLALKAEAMSQRALTIMSESTKTATQTNAENSESNSRLDDIAEDTENTVNNAFNAYSLMRYSKEATGRILVNRDFNLVESSGIATELGNLYTRGIITHKTALKGLVKNEVVDIEDIDQEIEGVKAEGLGGTEDIVTGEE